MLECFKKLQAFVEQEMGNEIQKLQSDRGGEYMSKEFQEYLVTQSICHEVTCPYTPEQNGAAKRENHTLNMESARSMLHDKNLNLRLWGEAVQTTAYLLNRARSRSQGHKTPFEL